MFDQALKVVTPFYTTKNIYEIRRTYPNRTIDIVREKKLENNHRVKVKARKRNDVILMHHLFNTYDDDNMRCA